MFARPNPWRMEGGGSNGTPFRSGLSLGVVPNMLVAPAIMTAFTNAPLGVYALFSFTEPVGYQPSKKYCLTIAAPPPTKGVAIEVPCRTDLTHSSGRLAIPADTVTPGATTSGLMRPSEVGPMDENGARFENLSSGSLWGPIRMSSWRPASRARNIGRAALRGMEAVGISTDSTDFTLPANVILKDPLGPLFATRAATAPACCNRYTLSINSHCPRSTSASLPMISAAFVIVLHASKGDAMASSNELPRKKSPNVGPKCAS
mmetsp:Transcript_31546/g.89555  ORF Transcript_31546/g.89555 Transcript_31546/m.89555 type:complete len:261 (+) Transcript_31546:2956-3738(+)